MCVYVSVLLIAVLFFQRNKRVLVLVRSIFTGNFLFSRPGSPVLSSLVLSDYLRHAFCVWLDYGD